MIGKTVGHYQVLEKLGEGGMGEVYRARDTRLNRDVALKTLPASLAGDPERVARFSSEAHRLAALNHPNIVHVHGVEDAAPSGPCIVMELVSGRTLAEMLGSGPLPVADALGLARQIADALECAHEAGIVHRDLKPANIKVRDDGTVKVLDFGLAKSVDSAIRPAEDLMNSPTMVSPAATQAGMILGTAAYMSPEQAKGRPVDKRADIWAFGAILYEMLTGRGAFHGEDVSETLAAVLTRQIDLAGLPHDTPARLRALIRKCLVRDPKQRLRDIGDARIAIDDLLSGADQDPAGSPATPGAAPAWRRVLPWAIAAAAAAAAIAALVGRPDSPPATASRLVTRSAQSIDQLAGFVALSRDGSKLVYTTAGGARGFYLALRPIDRLESQPIPGTDDGRFPIFSPDGRSVAYSVEPGAVRRASLEGDGIVDVCKGDFTNGAAWGEDNTIVFSGSGGLMRVPAASGTPQPLTKIDPGKSERGHIRPQFLPGGRTLLFTITKTAANDPPEFAVLDLAAGTHRVVARGGDNGRFLSTGPGAGRGHLTYARDETLFALPFDLGTLGALGPEAPVIEGVSSNGPIGTADYSVAETGLLVYARAIGSQDRALTWIDRSGKAGETIPTPADFGATPRLSPDGSHVAAVFVDNPPQHGIGVLDIRRGTVTRLTREGASRSPVWMPDGSRVIFGATVDGSSGIYVAPADGGARPQRLFPTGGASAPLAVTPDGRTVLFSEKARLYLASTEPGQEKPAIRPLHDAPPAREGTAQISPDGRWVAYTADDSGAFEAYVHELPGPGRRERVSTNGATYVRWGAGGRELIFWNTGQSGNFAVSSVEAATTPSLRLGPPRELFVRSDATVHDVTRDGSRFLAWLINARSPAVFVTVTDWFEELRRRAPAAQ